MFNRPQALPNPMQLRAPGSQPQAAQNAAQPAQDRWASFFSSQGRGLPQVQRPQFQSNPAQSMIPVQQTPQNAHLLNGNGFAGGLFRAAIQGDNARRTSAGQPLTNIGNFLRGRQF